MATAKYTTLGQGTLNTTVNNSTNTIILDSGQGALFPSTGVFWIRIDAEFLRVTARSTDTLTADRAQDGSSAASHTAGAVITEVVTAAMLDQIRADGIQTGAYASKSAEKAGNLYLPTDSPYVLRDTGAVFAAWGPVMKLTPPGVTADFTWVNQGGATATDAGGTIILTVPNGSGTNLRGLKKSVPAASNFVVRGAWLSYMTTGGNTRSGLGVTDGTKWITFGPSNDASRSIDRWDSVTSFNAGDSPVAVQNSQMMHLMLWRISYVHSGTTFTFAVSHDGGLSFRDIGTNSSFLGTVTGAGIIIDSESNGQDVTFTIIDFSIV